MSFQPNPEQREAIDCREGAWLWLATAGSGKTSVLTERVKKLLMSGEPINEILALTFTAEAADNMLDRLQIKMSKSERFGFKTFHSFGLKVVFSEKDNLPFQLAENPFESMNGTKVIRDLLRTSGKKVSKQDLQEVQGSFSRIKRSSVILPSSFPKESVVLDQKKWGFLYPEYVRRMRAGGWIDFDDMLVEAVNLLEKPEIRERWQFKWVMADEGQDTDHLQFRMLQLISEKHKNVFVVADINQCQPPGTLVTVLEKTRNGATAAILVQKPIERLSKKDRVISWTKQDQRSYVSFGRKIKIARRRYSGNLLTIKSNGCETKVTPGHWLWCRPNKQKVFAKRVVYLMWREDMGFRVGQTWLANRFGQQNRLRFRMKQEKAEKCWILSVKGTRTEAAVEEQKVTVEFGIPYATFEVPTTDIRFKNHRTVGQIGEIFQIADRSGGFRCLSKYGRLFDYPFLDVELEQMPKLHGYRKIAACNLIPGIHDLPTTEINGSASIDSIERVHFTGEVFSLDVEKDNTYIADGIPVGNCMYGFRGAKPENIKKFSEWFPGAETRVLPENYRSTPEIVKFGQKVAPIKNELVKKMRTSNPSGLKVEMKAYSGTAEEVTRVLEEAAKNPGNSAILARTNQQVGFFETECTLRGIKFHLLGKSGFWKTPEIRNVLGLAKFLSSGDKAETYPQQLVQHLRSSQDQDPGAFLDRIIEAARLRDLYSNDEYEDEANFALGNLDTIVQIAYRFESLEEFLAFANRATHASRKSKQAITLGTIHAAKGLEWDNVFVVGVQEGRIPHEKSSDMQEEQRILYVSVSRPRKRLHISYVGAISRFLEDLEETNVETDCEKGSGEPNSESGT